MADEDTNKMDVLLEGQGASPGIRKGVVYVVEDPLTEEGYPMKREIILVAPHFTPISLPLFVNAQGFVVNHGGLASHAAIIARELGIPCITNTKQATDILKDGMTIQINGETGEVILEESFEGDTS